MRKKILCGMMAFGAAATTLGAQVPGRAGMAAGPIDNTAEFLLSRTGELRLTDAQVTRLAAIARRSAERRQALRAQLDSLRPDRGPGMARDSAARDRLRQRMEQMRPVMDRLREQSRADRRDAIAVLTPDQQADAWERVARAGQMGRGVRSRFAGPRPGAFGRGMRRGGMQRAGMMPGRGFAPGRGMGPGRMAAPNDSAGPGRRMPRRPATDTRP